MTIDQALNLKNSNLQLIGGNQTKTGINVGEITDGIVVPNDCIDAFYKAYHGLIKEFVSEPTNDELLLSYPSRTYSVHVIRELPPEGSDRTNGDISNYIDINL